MFVHSIQILENKRINIISSCYFLFSTYRIMTLKTTKIIYRVATLALAAFILPGLFFMNSELAIEGLKHVGLTDALRLQQLLGYASPVAILAIII